MKQRMEYVPDNLAIFEGFYESYLYNSDMEYNFNINRGEDEPECEIDNFEAYMNDVGKAVVEELAMYCGDDGLVSGIEFKSISSPRYYNFSTDKLVTEADIDLDALKEWVLSDDGRKSGFDSYLREKYTSYDGFMSFVENSIDGYFTESYEKYYDVLVDYYFLTKFTESDDIVKYFRTHSDEVLPYNMDIYEVADGIFYKHMVPIEEEAV